MISFIISIKLAVVTTIIIVIISIPLAALFAYKKILFKQLFLLLFKIPLVMPPVVIGFFFLLIFSPNSIVGGFLNNSLGINLMFSFEGLVLISAFYSFPFLFMPIYNGMEKVDEMQLQNCKIIGKSQFTILFKIIIPQIKSNLISGLGMTFAHVVGEFGIVLMVGGSIVGVTKVASISIYEEIEKMNYSEAIKLSVLMALLALIVLSIIQFFNRGKESVK